MLTLRLSEPRDCRAIWEWRNDPHTRQASFNSSSISWEEHVKWYSHLLDDASWLSWIIGIQPSDLSIGHLRFQLQDDDAIISINVAPTHRGKGLGSRAIVLGTLKLFDETSKTVSRAFIKPDNAVSIRAFEHAGYHMAGETIIQGLNALIFESHRSRVEDSSDHPSLQ